MISASSEKTVYDIVINSVLYSFSLSNERIDYIQTQSKYFMSPEGFKIGDDLTYILLMSGKEIKKESGWAYYIPLESGWNAAFVVGNSMTEPYSLADNIKINFFFKRK